MQKSYCSNCGQLVSPQANFCPYCGARQYHPAYSTPPAQPAQQPQPLAQPQQPPQPQSPPSTPQAPPQQPEMTLIPRRHLAPRAQLLFFLNYIIMTGVLLPFLIAYLFFEPFIALGMLGAYFLLCYLGALLSHNNFYFSIDEYGFEKDYGVFFKRHVSIPYEQIANVNTKRTILDRFLGTARLDIETAGSAVPHKREIAGGIMSSAEGHLPGISDEDARKFHDILLQNMSQTDN